jgi:hypothetical protein
MITATEFIDNRKIDSFFDRLLGHIRRPIVSCERDYNFNVFAAKYQGTALISRDTSAQTVRIASQLRGATFQCIYEKEEKILVSPEDLSL